MMQFEVHKKKATNNQNRITPQQISVIRRLKF
jgi:hypothetical protein